MIITRLRGLLADLALMLLLLVMLLLIPFKGANAAQIYVCQGDVSGASTGARTIGGTSSAVPSGTLYVLNSQGCTLVTPGDLGYFQSQGYVQNAATNTSVLLTGLLPASGTTDIVGPTLPAGTYLQQIIVSNSTASAVTGGIAIGTTANATDIVTALTCAGNCLTFVTDATMLKRVFSTTAGQTIHVAPVTSSNGANLTISFIWGYF